MPRCIAMTLPQAALMPRNALLALREASPRVLRAARAVE
jgi:hypothetical protein